MHAEAALPVHQGAFAVAERRAVQTAADCLPEPTAAACRPAACCCAAGAMDLVAAECSGLHGVTADAGCAGHAAASAGACLAPERWADRDHKAAVRPRLQLETARPAVAVHCQAGCSVSLLPRLLLQLLPQKAVAAAVQHLQQVQHTRLAVTYRQALCLHAVACACLCPLCNACSTHLAAVSCQGSAVVAEPAVVSLESVSETFSGNHIQVLRHAHCI